ncbi:unnamed protein product [Ixodes persulcatus]
MAQNFRFLLLLLLFLVSVKLSSGTLFDLEDVIYQILVRNCSYNERLVTFDVTGDNKTRGRPEYLATKTIQVTRRGNPDRKDNCPEFLRFASFLRHFFNKPVNLCHEGSVHIGASRTRRRVHVVRHQGSRFHR